MRRQYEAHQVREVMDLLSASVSNRDICLRMGWEKWTFYRFKQKYLKDYVPNGESRPYADSRYYVFSDGRVWSCGETRFLKGEIDRDGYLVYGSMRQIGLESKAHRLVLTVFDRAPNHEEQGRHLDGNCGNNTIGNLTWGTCSDNQIDRIMHGRHHWVKHGLYLSKGVRTRIRIVRSISTTQGD